DQRPRLPYPPLARAADHGEEHLLHEVAPLVAEVVGPPVGEKIGHEAREPELRGAVAREEAVDDPRPVLARGPRRSPDRPPPLRELVLRRVARRVLRHRPTLLRRRTDSGARRGTRATAVPRSTGCTQPMDLDAFLSREPPRAETSVLYPSLSSMS